MPINILSNIAGIQEAINTLDRIAKWRVPEKGWTLSTAFWEDNTFQLEYRHKNDEGVHRFFYCPHESDRIHHILCTVEQLESNCVFHEYLDIED